MEIFLHLKQYLHIYLLGLSSIIAAVVLLFPAKKTVISPKSSNKVNTSEKMAPRSKATAKKSNEASLSPKNLAKANKEKTSVVLLASDDSEANINTKKTDKKVIKAKPKKIQKAKRNTIVLDFNAATDDEKEEERVEEFPTIEAVTESINNSRAIIQTDESNDGIGWTVAKKNTSSKKTQAQQEPKIKNKKEATKVAADLLDMLSMISDDGDTTGQISENPGRILLEELRNEALMVWV